MRDRESLEGEENKIHSFQKRKKLGKEWEKKCKKLSIAVAMKKELQGKRNQKNPLIEKEKILEAKYLFFLVLICKRFLGAL